MSCSYHISCKKIERKVVPLGGATRETGLEPATSAVTGRCSNQLNYSRMSSTLWAQQDSNL